MNLLNVIRLITGNMILLTGAPILTIGLIFFLFKDQEKVYTTQTKIYTGFASGYSIAQDGKSDYFSIQTKFDNLFETVKSRNTKKEISMRVLAYYLSKDSISDLEMKPENQKDFNELFTSELRDKIKVEKDERKTYLNLIEYANTGFDNELYHLLNATPNNPYPLFNYFSIAQLSDIGIRQESASDLVSIDYTANDPGICFQTLKITIDVVAENVKAIKSIESSDVVQYYTKAASDAQNKLNEAEATLSDYMKTNKVINYYEETKLISSRKENFIQNYQNEKLNLVAEEARLIRTEKQLTENMQSRLNKGEILRLREELTNINNALIVDEIQQLNNMGGASSDSTENLPKDSTYILMEERAQELELLLEEKINEVFANDVTVEGNSARDVAAVWLETIFNIERSKAKLQQYEIFANDFEETYSLFSRLGSDIKRMERKIGVLEREYLAMLSSLNAARMRKQSIELSGDLKIVDDPFYPLNPEKSKTKMIMAVGGAATFIFVLAIIILLDFIDRSIKTIDRFENLTDLKLIGAFPVLREKEMEQTELLRKRLLNQVVNKIHLSKEELAQGKIKKPFILLFASSRDGEGKSQMSRLIAEKMRAQGDLVTVLNPVINGNEQPTLLQDEPHEHNIYYEVPENFRDVTITDGTFLDHKIVENADYVFIELPAMSRNNLPLALIKISDFMLFVAKANRVWSRADRSALDEFQRINQTVVKLFLNGVNIYDLEPIVGEIPRNRGKIRTKLKEIASFKFKRNQF